MTIKKVVLIEPRSPGTNVFSFARIPLLGLPILGGILQKMKLEVKIFCENLASINWQEVSKADLVGISSLTSLAPRAYQIVKEVKRIAKETKREIRVVMGGPHPTFLPEEALLSGADFVVRHEGEETLKELVESLQGTGSKSLNEIPGLSYRDGGEIKHNPNRPLIMDLDQIPLPDFSLIEGVKKINIFPVQTSRGCPYDCEFCSVTQMFGRKFRYRNPENIIREMEKINPQRHIFIVDDNFSGNPTRTLALLETMKKSGIKREWSTQERVSIAQKPEILKMMKETGCSRLYQGIESFNPEALNEWNKGQTPEQIKQAVPIIHSYGLSIHGMLIQGGDADTPETIERTITETIRCDVDTAQFFILTPPPGTRIHKRLQQEGRIFDEQWDRYDGQHIVFNPRQMSAWQVQKLSIEAFQRFYSLWRGVKWFVRGKIQNTFPVFYERWAINRWLKENKEFLEGLRRRQILQKS